MRRTSVLSAAVFSLILAALISGCASRGKVVTVEDRAEKIVEIKEGAGITVRDWTPVIAKEEAPEKPAPAASAPEIKTPADGVTKERAPETQKPAAAAVPAEKTRIIENKAFKPGEKLTFAISYLGLTAATAEVQIGDFVKLKGRKCYHIITKTKVVPLVAALVRVDDLVETFFDAEGIYSRRMIKSLREGNYEKDVILEFDPASRSVKEIEKSGTKSFTGLPDFCHDILSAFFYFRTQELEPGKDVVLPVYADGKVNNLKVRILRKEKVRIPLGTYNAVVVAPLLDFESIFKQEGEVTIWLSDDERHIPLMMKSKVFVSTVSAKLIDAVIPE